MRPVYAVSGGVSKFAKARPDKTFQAIIKEAYDYSIEDIELDFPTFTSLVDGSVASYFSDHFSRQLMSGIMAQDYLGLCPKPSHRVEGGGATGGLCFQEAWKSVASGHMDVCVAYGFETMSHVETWKGNEFIALASDVSWDYQARPAPNRTYPGFHTAFDRTAVGSMPSRPEFRARKQGPDSQ